MVGYQQDDTLTPNKKLIAGCISGVVTRFLSQPLDVLKIRTQLQRRKTSTKQFSFFGMSKKILQEEGLFAFWHGHNLGQLTTLEQRYSISYVITNVEMVRIMIIVAIFEELRRIQKSSGERRIQRTEMVFGKVFWHPAIFSCMHSVLSTTSQFYIYEITTKYVFSSPVNPKYKSILEFLCGICAGSCSATLVTPLEVIRVRQMLVKEQYRGFMNGAKAVYKTGGLLAFFEGWAAGVLMLGPQVGITFSVFSFLQPVLLSYLYPCDDQCDHAKANAHKAKHLLLATTIAGSIAGLVSKIMCYPLDLAKRRLQIASHRDDEKFFTPSTSKNVVKCTTLIQCLRETVKMDGFLGLYSGLTVTIYKAQLANVLTFTTYELVCYFIR